MHEIGRATGRERGLWDGVAGGEEGTCNNKIIVDMYVMSDERVAIGT